MYRDVNMAFGDIVKVTPSSKVVGDLALFLVSHDLSVAKFLSLPADHHLAIPNSVVDMIEGSLGEPEGGWPEDVVRVVLKGRKPRTGRSGAALPPADFATVRREIAKDTGLEPSETDSLSWLMYPSVYSKFSRARQMYGDLEVLPTPQFFYGMEKGEEITIDIEEGKTLVVKFLAVSDPHEDGTRTVFFELNGRPREVDVRDRSLETSESRRRKADPSKPGEVGAPLPGLVTTLAVNEGDVVEKGDRILVIEAMKMQSTVYAPVSGRVAMLAVHSGQQVEAKDLLVVLET